MLIWFCFLTGILFVSLRCSRIVSLLSKFWNLTRLSLVCCVVVVLFWGFSSKGLISVFHSYFFFCFFPSIVTLLGWLVFRITTNWMILLPDLFFLMFLRFPPTLSTSLSFHTTWQGNYLSLSSADFWLSNYVYFTIWAIIFWSYFQRSPSLFFHWNLFFPFEHNIPSNKLEEINYVYLAV